MPERVRIGQIVGTHGLKGHLKIDLLTDFPERLNVGQKVYLKDSWVEIVFCRWQKGRPIIGLEGIHHIAFAEELKWQYLEGLPLEDSDLKEDEFFSDDLVGMKVVTTSGQELGVVDDVQKYPAHDVIQVGEVLIPAIKEFVKMVDFDAETITVQLIEGMIP
jgi:16S rRNA processing protein RimM